MAGYYEVQGDASASPHFRVWTCGTFRIERHVGTEYKAVRTSEWGGSSYPRLLLKALLCCPGRQARREALIEMLWPDTDPEQAAHYLNTATTKLRKVLQPIKGQESLLLTEDGSFVYRLEGQPLLWMDADEGVALLKQAEQRGRMEAETLPLLEKAGALFNTGIFLQEEEGFWAAGRRAVLDQTRYRCRIWLAETYSLQGMPGLAETILSLLLEEDPLDEDVLCRMLDLLHRQAMTHKALQLYERAGQLFEQEGLELTEATRMLAIRLQEERCTVFMKCAMVEEIRAPLPESHHDAFQPAHVLGCPASLHADMVQLPQTVVYEQAPDEHGVFLPSESGIVVPPGSSVQMLSLTTARIDLPIWFGLQVNDLKAIGASWQGSPVPYQQQQASIHAELERWNSMADQNYQRTSDYLITRRTALATLATLSTRLLTRVQRGPLSTIVVEEFLRESTTAITASWELLNGNGLATIECSLPRYLPLLINLVHQPSKYQQQAVYLSTQGCLIMSLVCYHRLRFQEDLAYARQAVEIAKIAKDDNLHVYALVLLGGAFKLMGQTEMMLEKHQEAAFHRKQVVLPLQSKLLAELALSHAQNGQVEAALSHLSEARHIFSDTFGDVPGFISADYNIFQLILFEGMTHLALAKCDTDNVLRHSTQAQTALAQFGKLPSTISVPERTKIELINQQAAAAVGTGNMEEFVHHFKAGVNGAKALGSQKRKQEAIANWKAARAQWPHEKQVLELADVLMQQ